MAASGWLTLILLLAGSVPARAEFYPLSPWFFYGQGNGATWDGSSSSPDNAQLSVTFSAPVFQQYGTSVAQGSEAVLQIAPETTYIVTLSASVSGSGSGRLMMIDDVDLVTGGTSVSGGTWRRYTNAVTIGGAADPRVGRGLRVQLALDKFSGSGTTTVNFTNIQFQAIIQQPALSCSVPAPGTLRLSWPTNFQGYVAEQAAGLGTNSWAEMTNVPVVLGDRFVIQTGIGVGARFFRLRKP